MPEALKTLYSRRAVTIAIVILMVFIFSLPAVYNGFPLINSDSGAYLQSANDFSALVDRPMFYGYFIHYFNFYNSLWPVIVAQNLLLAWIIHLVFRTFQRFYRPINLIFCALLITFTTCAAWFSCQIMTDIFTSISILSLSILAINKELKRIEIIFLSGIFFASTAFHLSHLPMNTLLVISLILIQIIWRNIKFTRLPLLVGLLVLCWLAVPYKNYKYFGTYTVAYAGNVLFTGRLMETGLLQKYLDAHCASKDYKLCQFKNEFPPYVAPFIWNYPASIVDKMGGFDSCKKEFSEINRGVLNEYPFQFAFISAGASIRNLITWTVGPGLFSYDDRSSPSMRIKKYYPESWSAYQQSKQQQNQLGSFPFLTSLQYIIVLASIISIIIYYTKNKKKLILNEKQINFTIILFLALLFNAIITGTLASAQDTRYESRVIWILPMFALILFTNSISGNSEIKYRQSNT